MLRTGCGKQPVAAKIGLFSSYAIGIPIAVALCFPLEWGLFGLWWGLTAGNVSCVCLCMVSAERQTATACWQLLPFLLAMTISMALALARTLSSR